MSTPPVVANKLSVHKFGGTSLGSVQRFAAVADLLAGLQSEPAAGMVVVVSAMSGSTSQLIAGARAAAEGSDQHYWQVKAGLLERHLQVVSELLQRPAERLQVSGWVEDRLHDLERLYRSIAVLGEVTARGLDAVSSFGELLSSHILAAALRERGLRAQAITAAELIVTDEHFGAARPLLDETQQQVKQRLLPLLEQGVLPVVTGYLAATRQGAVTTLGRGGSDYSAALLGAALPAGEVCIWSDVDGILTADPNLVPEATTLDELTYEEAATLAYFGADVLHPKTIRPVAAAGIPLRLRNSFNPGHPGTLVSAQAIDRSSPIRRSVQAAKHRRVAIISTNGLALIRLGSQDDSWNPLLASRALQSLGVSGLDVPMFSQSFSEHSLNLVVRQQDQEHCLKLLEEAFRDELAGKTENISGFHLDVRLKVATVSVVGVPQGQDGGIVSRAFAALGTSGTRVIAVAQSSRENSVSFCIPAEQLVATVRGLHADLGLSVPAAAAVAQS
jgi:aspartokinase/homoserine dehydrogenase 1